MLKEEFDKGNSDTTQPEIVSETVANRARARVQRWAISEPSQLHLAPAEQTSCAWTFAERNVSLIAPAGTFAAGNIDAGSQLLIDQLTTLQAREHILDLAAGIGLLGFAALSHAHGAQLPHGAQNENVQVHALEADARAVTASTKNAEHLGISQQFSAHWWAAGEALPENVQRIEPSQLTIVMNPPFHQGKQVDLHVPQQLFALVTDLVQAGAQALIVANRQLPYEQWLTSTPYRKLHEDHLYKLFFLGA